LTTWNALFLKGLVDAYITFNKQEFLDLAIGIANFIEDKCCQNGRLLHQPSDHNRTIYGFLDDYAFTIEAYISLYEATFDEVWINKTKSYSDIAISLFYDENIGTFYYSSSEAEVLIARKSEIMDNVIPASSSTIVRDLYKLGLLFDNSRYTEIADCVFANVFPHIKSYGSAYSNWAIQLLDLHFGVWEIAITGDDGLKWREELDKYYIPNKITLGGTNSKLPLLEHKDGAVLKAYLCQDKTCSLPQPSIANIIELINNKQG
jgi:uncharacterized protein YyaL (SSP411 family)